MPRISNSSFKVNDALQQQVELSAIDASVTIPISTTSPLDVTSNLAEVHGSAISLGQKASANSLPVVLPSDQAGLNVTSNLAEVHGTPVTLGQKVAGSSIPVVLASSQNVDTNMVQVGGVAITLDQQTMTNSFPVTIASNQSALASNLYYVDDNAKINTATTSSAFQVGMYGWNGSAWQQASISNGGNLKVESELENHAGTQGNLANASAYTDGSNSAVIDVSNKTLLTVFGDKSDTSNSVQPQVSADNVNWVDTDYTLYPKMNGDFFQNIDNVAINYFRLKFTGAGTATATLLSNNH